jgi:4-hydroxybenzoate polyprenyltransferase
MPSVAVTAFATALAASAGASVAVCATLAIAFLAGQLSIGWSNDRLDVALDRQARRTDKPLAVALELGAVDRAIAIALVVTIGASLQLGWRAGLLHLVAVAAGWLYNIRLKATALSWLPYAVAFAAIPAIVTFALPGHPAPAGWVVAAGALLGGAAHLTNALPDLEADREFGISGFPHRIGARPALLLACVALLAGSALLVLSPPGQPSAIRWVGLAVAASWTVVGSVFGWRHPKARWTFYGTVAIAGLDVALLIFGPPFTR